MKMMMVDDDNYVHIWNLDFDVHPTTIVVGGPMPNDTSKRIQAIDRERKVAIATDGDEHWLPKKWPEIIDDDGTPKLRVIDRDGNEVSAARVADEVTPRVED
jgi:hypothetical protein